MLTRRGALRLAGAAGLAGVAALAGCGVPPGRPDAAGGRALVDSIGAALASGDEARFLALFAAPLRTQAQVVWANARALPGFAVTAEGPLARAAWRAGPGRDPVVDRFRVDVGADGSIGALAPRAATAGIPVWWRHPVEVTTAPGAGLVATRSRASGAAPWLVAASEAAAHLAGAGLEPWASEWDGTLTVLVPEDLLDFGLGQHTAAYATSGASGEAGTITLNPTRLGEGDAADRVGLLVHEGVHVVTRSGASPAPLWAMEGLAEHVATRVWPAASEANARHLAQARDAGPPAALPTQEQLAAPGEEGARAYALAEVAVQACFARWGRDRVLAWFAGWPPGRPTEAEFTETYRDAVRATPAR